MKTFKEYVRDLSGSRDESVSEQVNKLLDYLKRSNLDNKDINIVMKLYYVIIAGLKSPVTKDIVIKMCRELTESGGFEDIVGSGSELGEDLENIAFKSSSPSSQFLKNKFAKNPSMSDFIGDGRFKMIVAPTADRTSGSGDDNHGD